MENQSRTLVVACSSPRRSGASATEAVHLARDRQEVGASMPTRARSLKPVRQETVVATEAMPEGNLHVATASATTAALKATGHANAARRSASPVTKASERKPTWPRARRRMPAHC